MGHQPMIEPGRRPSYRLSMFLVKAASLMVPSHARGEWLREWKAELWHRVDRGNESWIACARVAAGSFPHALWMLGSSLMLYSVGLDLRQALRALRRSPSFSVVTIATVALGIGATTSIYTVVDGVLLNPLPYPGGDRLVSITTTHRATGMDGLPVSHATFLELGERSRSLDAIEGAASEVVDLVDGETPIQVGLAHATAGLLPMLGVQPTLGRGFIPEEMGPAAPRVALLSDGLWRERYGADPAVLGRILKLKGVAHEVVGVLPRGFDFVRDVDVWTPVLLEPDYTRALFGGLELVGRRAEGISLEDANSELEALAVRFHARLGRHLPRSGEPDPDRRAGSLRQERQSCEYRLHPRGAHGAILPRAARERSGDLRRPPLAVRLPGSGDGPA